MSYEFYIAKRYFYSRRRAGFISLINYISIIGVMIGVASLIIVLSVMNGFETEVRSRIIGFDAHIQFTGPFKGIDNYDNILKKLKSYDHVVGVSPYILNKGMISVRKNSDALIIKGVDPITVSEVSDVKNNVIYGEFNLDTVLVDEGSPLPGMVLGKNLAMRLDVNLNDQVWVYGLPRVRKSLISLYQQHQFTMPFRVAGLFETG
jgi:lipoprotein-releasing system permease protein